MRAGRERQELTEGGEECLLGRATEKTYCGGGPVGPGDDKVMDHREQRRPQPRHGVRVEREVAGASFDAPGGALEAVHAVLRQSQAGAAK